MVETCRVTKRHSQSIILFKVPVKPVHLTAPGIEAPADASHKTFIILYKCRRRVPCPRVVGRDLQKIDRGKISEHLLRPVFCFLAYNHINFFALRDLSDDLRKNLPRPFRPVRPGAGALGEDHYRSLMGLKFRRHEKTVVFREGINLHESLSLKSS